MPGSTVDEPAPYPPEEPGTRLRRIPFPVASPERKRKPMRATRTDGTEVDIMATLGARSPADRSPDEMVSDWRAV
jgi:hypothetical protein